MLATDLELPTFDYTDPTLRGDDGEPVYARRRGSTDSSRCRSEALRLTRA